MNRILFVDDDVSLLDALRVRLRPMQREWSMTFAESGAQALIALQRDRYDVIVSDIHMPGMRGTRLLRTVSELWPQTIRIALSGFGDPRIAQLAPIAHRLLGKPCEHSLLVSTLAQCLALQDLMGEPALRALVGRPHRLAPLRRTHAKLRALLTSESVTPHEAAQCVVRDTVIAARLLQAVNSALLRPEGPITQIEEAVRRFGLKNLRLLIASSEVFAQWPRARMTAPLDLALLQQHTDSVVQAAQALTEHTALEADTLAAALLHDVGYWILAQERPHELMEAIKVARAGDRPLPEAERQVIGASHAEIGAYLLGLWGLPQSVVHAVAHHHTPEMKPIGEFGVAAALAVALALCGSEDTDAFPPGLQPSARVGPEFLESPSAPFNWTEAARRVADYPNSTPSL